MVIEHRAGTWMPPASRTWTVNIHRVPSLPRLVAKGASTLARAADEAALDIAAQGWTFTPDHRVVVKVLDASIPLSLTITPE